MKVACNNFFFKFFDPPFLYSSLFNINSYVFFRGDYESKCQLGYEGPLCGACIKNYAFDPTNKKLCVQCNENNVLNTLSIIGLFLVWILLLAVFLQ